MARSWPGVGDSSALGVVATCPGVVVRGRDGRGNVAGNASVQPGSRRGIRSGATERATRTAVTKAGTDATTAGTGATGIPACNRVIRNRASASASAASATATSAEATAISGVLYAATCVASCGNGGNCSARGAAKSRSSTGSRSASHTANASPTTSNSRKERPAVIPPSPRRQGSDAPFYPKPAGRRRTGTHDSAAPPRTRLRH